MPSQLQGECYLHWGRNVPKLRGVLPASAQEEPLHPNSRFAMMSVLFREYLQGKIPDTVPLPPLATRVRKNVCGRQGCFKDCGG